MRKRKTFETTVDAEEFGRIQESLAESQRMRILICQDKGVPVAGLVASAMGDSAIYLLGATSDDGLNSKGAYLLAVDHDPVGSRKTALDGTTWGHRSRRNPASIRFKRGFSGVDVCQIDPLVASDSAVSSGMVKAGLAMQRTFRGSSEHLEPCPISIKQLATEN